MAIRRLLLAISRSPSASVYIGLEGPLFLKINIFYAVQTFSSLFTAGRLAVVDWDGTHHECSYVGFFQASTILTRFLYAEMVFAVYLFITVAKWLQDFKLFVTLVYVIYPTLWYADSTGAHHFASVANKASVLCQSKCHDDVGTKHPSEMYQWVDVLLILDIKLDVVYGKVVDSGTTFEPVYLGTLVKQGAQWVEHDTDQQERQRIFLIYTAFDGGFYDTLWALRIELSSNATLIVF